MNKYFCPLCGSNNVVELGHMLGCEICYEVFKPSDKIDPKRITLLILNRYTTTRKPMESKVVIDPMDYYKIAEEIDILFKRMLKKTNDGNEN